MSSIANDPERLDRRSFVKAALVPAALPLAAALQGAATAAEQAAGPEIIDSNVHLFEWPFRKLKYDQTPLLVAKLRKHRITQAWAGSFEAVLHKQIDASNRRLAEECRRRGEGVLIPIGCINPAAPDWEEDLRRCHEQYRMPGVRVYPSYHGYAFELPEFGRLLAAAQQRSLLVQIVLRLEDERVHHPALNIPLVNVAPLVELLKKSPAANVQLLNAAGPLLGNNVAALVKETTVTLDIAAVEGNGGLGKLIAGELYSYRGAIPPERLLFGTHAPFFPCESALIKLFESPLGLEQLQKIMNDNARRLIA